MEKFTFRFDTILTTKEKIEDDKKNKFGISMQKLAAGQNQLEKLSDKKNDLVDKWEKRLQKTVEISELRNLSYNLDMMQDIID
ncbi:MAG TPA: hypothetical protein VFC70_05575, partial [Oscillospiraceae bacterium]|nr:hypothetical protein [Oscillospiraceae bacterium]